MALSWEMPQGPSPWNWIITFRGSTAGAGGDGGGRKEGEGGNWRSLHIPPCIPWRFLPVCQKSRMQLNVASHQGDFRRGLLWFRPADRFYSYAVSLQSGCGGLGVEGGRSRNGKVWNARNSDLGWEFSLVDIYKLTALLGVLRPDAQPTRTSPGQGFYNCTVNSGEISWCYCVCFFYRWHCVLKKVCQ